MYRSFPSFFRVYIWSSLTGGGFSFFLGFLFSFIFLFFYSSFFVFLCSSFFLSFGLSFFSFLCSSFFLGAGGAGSDFGLVSFESFFGPSPSNCSNYLSLKLWYKCIASFICTWSVIPSYISSTFLGSNVISMRFVSSPLLIKFLIA